MPRIKIIVNPRAGRGRAAQLEPAIRRHMEALGTDAAFVRTTRPGEAIDLARRAREEGFDTVVAVGGDGTSHEVINGLVAHADDHVAGTLGCIPAGSGNDFAIMCGVPQDVTRACEALVRGAERAVDIGEVSIDGRLRRVFSNAVGIGFDALVVHETRRHPRRRGLALYIPAVLRTIMVTLSAPRLAMTLDDVGIIEEKALLAVVSNGPREGGAFLVAPGARTDDGRLDLTVATEMTRLQMLAMLPRFVRGTHVGDPRIVSRQVRDITISSADALRIHVDGEILCEHAHEVSLRVLPGRLRLRTIDAQPDG